MIRLNITNALQTSLTVLTIAKTTNFTANSLFWTGYFANIKSRRKKLSSPKSPSLYNNLCVLLIYNNL